MLQGKYLRLAIRFILTEQCHLPLVVQHRVSIRFGLLVYLGRRVGRHLLSEHHLVWVTTRGNLTTLPTSNPPSLHLSSHHPCSTPHGCVHPPPCPIWKITPKYAIIRRRVFRMEIRGQSAYSWSEKPRDIQLGKTRLRPSLCLKLTIGTNLWRSQPVVEISPSFSRQSSG